MTTNRLSKSAKPQQGSVYTAAEWAAIAEEKGLTAMAREWRKAAREGWDERNYDPVAAADHKRSIDDKRRSWGGEPLFSHTEKYRGEIIDPSEPRAAQ